MRHKRELIQRIRVIRNKGKSFKLTVCAVIFAVGIGGVFEPVSAKTITPDDMIGTGLYNVDCTAYWNPNGNLTANGSETVEGVTIAGAKEWLGCMCIMYDGDMNYIGTYDFTDTGYGRDGDILRGETVDLYFDDYDTCINWGRKKVYIQVIRAEG